MGKRSKRGKARNQAAAGSKVVAVTTKQPSGVWLEWVGAVVLAAAVFFTYLSVWQAGFVWDDDDLITSNPAVTHADGLLQIWTTKAADVCPLTLTVCWLEYRLWGANPLPYHVLSVLLHAGSAVLLWRLLKRLKVMGAWAGAALWALHPVQVESVAWAVEIKNTLSGVFFLLTLLWFDQWLKSGASFIRGRPRRTYLLVLLFAALAMASKSSTVILPGVLCLQAWWTQRKWQWRDAGWIAPVAGFSCIATAVSMWTQSLMIANSSFHPQSRAERIAEAGQAVWFYLGKLAWPEPLMAIYPQWRTNPESLAAYVPTLLVLVVLIVLWSIRSTWLRPIFFAFAYFLLALAPVLGLASNGIFRYTLVFDHFQYLASMGPLVLLAAALAAAVRQIGAAEVWLQALPGGVLAFVLAGASYLRAGVYENSHSLWADAMAKNPDSSLVQSSLATVLIEIGQIDDAEAQSERALTLDPSNAAAFCNLGYIAMQRGQLELAIDDFRDAIRVSPSCSTAFSDLASLLPLEGHAKEGIQMGWQAIKIADFAEARHSLGDALLRDGQADAAIAQFQRALVLNPRYPEAYNDLGLALMKKGKTSEAIIQFQHALDVNPNYAIARQNLQRVQEGH